MRVFSVLRREGEIMAQATLALPEGAALLDALNAACPQLDIPRPVVLRKHESEWERFGRAVFRPGDFIESVAFGRFEVEQLKEPRKSADIRNAQGHFG